MPIPMSIPTIGICSLAMQFNKTKDNQPVKQYRILA
jgi:hypothetical protein